MRRKTKKPVTIWIIFAIFAAVITLLILTAWLRPSAEQNLQNWLQENQYALESKEVRRASASPFSRLSMSGDETFYRVTVKTADGKTRSGWLRCAGKFTALLSPSAEVIWDN